MFHKSKAIKISFILISFLTIFNIPTWAQSWTQCKAYDFTEMTSMTKKELEKLYCQNERTTNSNEELTKNALDGARKFTAMGATKESQQQLRESDTYMENMKACWTENERILRALRKVDSKATSIKCK